jgi:hypothetical protein
VGGDATLLDAVPELGLRFTEMPEPVQRKIYDALRPRVEYDNRDRGVKLQATITPALISAWRRSRQQPQPRPVITPMALTTPLVRAPGREQQG